jgi:hypothetical protein
MMIGIGGGSEFDRLFVKPTTIKKTPPGVPQAESLTQSLEASLDTSPVGIFTSPQSKTTTPNRQTFSDLYDASSNPSQKITGKSTSILGSQSVTSTDDRVTTPKATTIASKGVVSEASVNPNTTKASKPVTFGTNNPPPVKDSKPDAFTQTLVSLGTEANKVQEKTRVPQAPIAEVPPPPKPSEPTPTSETPRGNTGSQPTDTNTKPPEIKPGEVKPGDVKTEPSPVVPTPPSGEVKPPETPVTPEAKALQEAVARQQQLQAQQEKLERLANNLSEVKTPDEKPSIQTNNPSLVSNDFKAGSSLSLNNLPKTNASTNPSVLGQNNLSANVATTDTPFGLGKGLYEGTNLLGSSTQVFGNRTDKNLVKQPSLDPSVFQSVTDEALTLPENGQSLPNQAHLLTKANPFVRSTDLLNVGLNSNGLTTRFEASLPTSHAVTTKGGLPQEVFAPLTGGFVSSSTLLLPKNETQEAQEEVTGTLATAQEETKAAKKAAGVNPSQKIIMAEKPEVVPTTTPVLESNKVQNTALNALPGAEQSPSKQVLTQGDKNTQVTEKVATLASNLTLKPDQSKLLLMSKLVGQQNFMSTEKKRGTTANGQGNGQGKSQEERIAEIKGLRQKHTDGVAAYTEKLRAEEAKSIASRLTGDMNLDAATEAVGEVGKGFVGNASVSDEMDQVLAGFTV